MVQWIALAFKIPDCLHGIFHTITYMAFLLWPSYYYFTYTTTMPQHNAVHCISDRGLRTIKVCSTLVVFWMPIISGKHNRSSSAHRRLFQLLVLDWIHSWVLHWTAPSTEVCHPLHGMNSLVWCMTVLSLAVLQTLPPHLAVWVQRSSPLWCMVCDSVWWRVLIQRSHMSLV